jgi:hypothetical protein
MTRMPTRPLLIAGLAIALSAVVALATATPSNTSLVFSGTQAAATATSSPFVTTGFSFNLMVAATANLATTETTVERYEPSIAAWDAVAVTAQPTAAAGRFNSYAFGPNWSSSYALAQVVDVEPGESFRIREAGSSSPQPRVTIYELSDPPSGGPSVGSQTMASIAQTTVTDGGFAASSAAVIPTWATGLRVCLTVVSNGGQSISSATAQIQNPLTGDWLDYSPAVVNIDGNGTGGAGVTPSVACTAVYPNGPDNMGSGGVGQPTTNLFIKGRVQQQRSYRVRVGVTTGLGSTTRAIIKGGLVATY